MASISLPCSDYSKNLERIDDQLLYYSKTANKRKKCYYRWSVIQIIIIGIIPFLSSLPKNEYIGYSISIISTLSVIATAIMRLYAYEKDWIRYRNMENLIQYEKAISCAKVNKYAGLSNDDAMSLLIETLETLFINENLDWKTYQIEQISKTKESEKK